MPRRSHTAPLEKDLHLMVARYLQARYPSVIFTSDASGMRVTPGLRVELKKKRCQGYKIVDLIVDEPRGGYHGLRVEIKRDRSELYDRHGNYRKREHIQEQVKAVGRLSELGYFAVFACGWDECIKVIDHYMKLK